MMNFLQETLGEILGSGHTELDVVFVGSYDGKYRMSWEKFKEKANFIYDLGYGAQHIATDLIVYFKDGSYMDRKEYDGSEWWEYHGLLHFSEDDDYQDFDVLGGECFMWDSVEIILISKIDKPLKVAVESDNIKVEYEEETGRTNISFLL